MFQTLQKIQTFSNIQLYKMDNIKLGNNLKTKIA